MKKLLASALAITFVLGAASGAQANWFWQKDKDNQNNNNQARMERPVNYDSNNPEAQKWVYSGNNGYRTLSAQVATQDSMQDNDDTAFVVHPVSTATRFNGSLRQGDMGQSMQTRVNHSFNN